MKYRQLTSEDRYTISVLKRQGYSPTEIAEMLSRHRSTIYRELARNSCNDGRYRVEKADSRTRGRRSRSRKKKQFNDTEIKLVGKYLNKKWSPMQIANRLHQDKLLSISHETIYRYIKRDKYYGGDLHSHLRQFQKQKRKRYKTADSRGVLAGKRPISERPATVEKRIRIGHWEIDTVQGGGSTDCVVTLVERKSGYAIIGKLKNKTNKELNACVIKLIRAEGRKIKTITADNGTEFHGYKEIEKKTGVKFYFATPYHSWERGTNENTNGLIRQYLPKRQCMASLTQRECNKIAKQLNHRPRERHHYRTPHEVYLNKRVALQS
jgi:IS30 family transposase